MMNDPAGLADIAAVFMDMDGTIYNGSKLFPTTRPFLDFLKRHHIRYAFCSNNSTRGKKEYAEKLLKFGLKATAEEFYISTDFLIDVFRRDYPHYRKLCLIGMPPMARELELAGFSMTDDDPDAVVISFDLELDYRRLCHAAYLVKQGVPGFASHPDYFCPTDQPTCLIDCGSVAKCVELASGKTLTMLGKPHPDFLRQAAARFGVPPERALMIGDRMATDIAAGVYAGTKTCRITGPGADLSSHADVTPDFTCRDLGELQALWERLTAEKR